MVNLRLGVFVWLCIFAGSKWEIQGFSQLSVQRASNLSPVGTLARRDTRLCAQSDDSESSKKKGVLDFIFNPYETKIPDEIRKDIYAAEANTPAAQDRTQRIGIYAIVAFSGILFAFFNGFITELRSGPTPDGSAFDMDDAGFGWITSNIVTEFLFTNKIGGLLCLFGGAASGLLAEAEFDTKRINAEKIYEEMVRRRAEKTLGGNRKKVQKRRAVKKRRSGKETKRLNALSEVVLEGKESTKIVEEGVVNSAVEIKSATSDDAVDEKVNNIDDGLMGKIKGFYEKADSMAASQALLLNKKLEDEGLIEKITDETGLKVIGRDAAENDKRKLNGEDK